MVATPCICTTAAQSTTAANFVHTQPGQGTSAVYHCSSKVCFAVTARQQRGAASVTLRDASTTTTHRDVNQSSCRIRRNFRSRDDLRGGGGQLRRLCCRNIRPNREFEVKPEPAGGGGQRTAAVLQPEMVSGGRETEQRSNFVRSTRN